MEKEAAERVAEVRAKATAAEGRATAEAGREAGRAAAAMVAAHSVEAGRAVEARARGGAGGASVVAEGGGVVA